MAIKQRKGIKKLKHRSFFKEYDYEILIVSLFLLGIFLLVEELEIKTYLYQIIRWFLFSIGDMIKIIRNSILLLFKDKNYELSDMVGVFLILFALNLAAKRWRDREIRRSPLLNECPKCGDKLQRIQRTYKQKIVSKIYFAQIKNYICKSCNFNGMKMINKNK